MYRVLITDPIHEAGIDLLKKDSELVVDNRPLIEFDELLSIVENYECIITRSRTPVTPELLERAKNLKVIGRAGVGVDNVAMEEASKRGILVVNAPGANTIGATELTIGHMINIIRNFHTAHNSILNYRWDRHSFMGTELYGKTLGIIGLGNIGSQVAIRCKAFGMKVYAYDPYIPREKGDRLGVKLFDNLYEMLKEVDIVTLHTPLTHETKNMITAKEISIMKDGAIIINCARGGLIKEWDLIEALRSNKLAGAGIDVFSKEPPPKELVDAFLELKDKVSLSPHIGANTYESQENVAIITAQQVIKALKGQSPEYLVNAPFPDLSVISLIKPQLDLAEKMGNFIIQWGSANIRKVRVEVIGDIAEYTKPISSAVLKGILKEMVDFPINIINASYVAKDRSIEVEEVPIKESQDFKHYIRIKIYTDEAERTVGGTIFENQFPKILQIDRFSLDLEPEGVMLVFENKDVPGVIGKIGTILGKYNVNIAGFKLGREKKGGIALGVLNLDSEAPDSVIQEVSSLPEIIFIKQVVIS